MPAALSPAPSLTLTDVAEGQTFVLDPVATQPYVGSPLFQVAAYKPSIYPQAGYNLKANAGEGSPINRPFPANPADLTQTSRFGDIGASAWVDSFPSVTTTANLVVVPLSSQSFDSGLNIHCAVGNSVPYAMVHTTKAQTKTGTRPSRSRGIRPRAFGWHRWARLNARRMQGWTPAATSRLPELWSRTSRPKAFSE